MTPAAKPREHTTHFDDCGCLSERHAREIADANAAILRLQKRLDAVRPVVAAAVAWQDGESCTCSDVDCGHCREQRGCPWSDVQDRLYDATYALPAADREWALKGE